MYMYLDNERKRIFPRYGLLMLPILLMCITVCCTANSLEDEVCGRNSKCSSCISSPNPACVWCTDPLYNQDREHGSVFRCATMNTLQNRGCPLKSIYQGKSSIRTASSTDTRRRAQMQPERIQVSLRRHETVELAVNFTQIKDFPLDMYFLMDFSPSMTRHRQEMQKVVLDLKDAMRRLTSACRVGFGTFSDKPMFPFVDSMSRNPCENTEQTLCDPPHTLRHFLTLTNDFATFQEALNKSTMAGNVDQIEGGLDAFLQVALCDEVIGWNRKARKVVVLSTDMGFHLAGDGRLAGLVSPVPMECRTKFGRDMLSGQWYVGYHDTVLFDYPSLAQVKDAIDEREIALVFTVYGDKMMGLYGRLVRTLDSPLVWAGQLENNSTNIVALVTDLYYNLTRHVRLMVHNEYQSSIQVDVMTKCRPNSASFQRTTDCILRDDEHLTVEYYIRLTVTECFPRNETRSVSFSVVGYEDMTTVEVSSVCECKECEQLWPPQSASQSPQCHHRGEFKCGVCECDRGYEGDFCDCTPEQNKALEKNCRPNASSHQITNAHGSSWRGEQVCSGLGTCSCGRCTCHDAQLHTGTHCECVTCPRAMDPLQQSQNLTEHPVECSNHGQCSCSGHCLCHPGFTGLACDCPQSISGCLPPSMKGQTGSLCSEHGKCHCGVCYCQEEYEGVFCQQHRDQLHLMDMCKDNATVDCVTCHWRREKSSSALAAKQEDCREKCHHTTKGLQLDVQLKNHSYSEEDLKSCYVYVSSKCHIRVLFQVQVWSNNSIGQVLMWIPTQVEVCSQLVPILITTGLSVLAIVVVTGVALLIGWKVAATLQDREELAEWRRAQSQEAFLLKTNPLYYDPVTKVKNPLFNAAGKPKELEEPL